MSVLGGVCVRSKLECLWTENLLAGINLREHPLESTAKGICSVSEDVFTV